MKLNELNIITNHNQIFNSIDIKIIANSDFLDRTIHIFTKINKSTTEVTFYLYISLTRSRLIIKIFDKKINTCYKHYS